MTRFTISGLEHMIKLLNTHPEFLSLPSFSQLNAVAEQAREASKKCGCNASKVYNANRHVFEMALTSLAAGDHLMLKRMLAVEQICFYVKSPTGGLQLKCI